MRPPLRIAVLECDTPVQGAYLKYGGYGNIFRALLEAGADALNQPELISSKHGLQVGAWDVVSKTEYPRLEDVDALLLTGSRHCAFDSHPWIVSLVDFVRRVLERQSRVRVIGVCFGHQIVGRALGVPVERSDAGWELSVLPVQLSAKGKEVFQRDHLNIHQMHRDIVTSFPPGVESLGSSPKCLNQGMYVPKKLITVEGHPEFTREIVTMILEKRRGQGVFGEEDYRDGLSRVDKPHDGVMIASAFLRFLLDD